MTKKWTPCFNCPLADCDDRDPRCGYRIALAAYQYAQRNDRPIDDEMRERYTQAKRELYGDHEHEKGESRQVFCMKWQRNDDDEGIREWSTEAFDLNAAMVKWRYHNHVKRGDCSYFEVYNV